MGGLIGSPRLRRSTATTLASGPVSSYAYSKLGAAASASFPIGVFCRQLVRQPARSVDPQLRRHSGGSSTTDQLRVHCFHSLPVRSSDAGLHLPLQHPVSSSRLFDNNSKIRNERPGQLDAVAQSWVVRPASGRPSLPRSAPPLCLPQPLHAERNVIRKSPPWRAASAPSGIQGNDSLRAPSRIEKRIWVATMRVHTRTASRSPRNASDRSPPPPAGSRLVRRHQSCQ